MGYTCAFRFPHLMLGIGRESCISHFAGVVIACVMAVPCWRVNLHPYAPSYIRVVVEVVTMIRSLEHWSVLAPLPNELLFEIFSWL